VASKSWREVVY